MPRVAAAPSGRQAETVLQAVARQRTAGSAASPRGANSGRASTVRPMLSATRATCSRFSPRSASRSANRSNADLQSRGTACGTNCCRTWPRNITRTFIRLWPASRAGLPTPLRGETQASAFSPRANSARRRHAHSGSKGNSQRPATPDPGGDAAPLAQEWRATDAFEDWDAAAAVVCGKSPLSIPRPRSRPRPAERCEAGRTSG